MQLGKKLSRIQFNNKTKITLQEILLYKGTWSQKSLFKTYQLLRNRKTFPYIYLAA